MATIQEFAAERGIKALFHFTRIENLDSILRHGLLTRSQCVEQNCRAVFNDAYRIDATDAVCASISFPNYKLFWPFRCDTRGAEWVVIVLHASVMWESSSAFCTANAASAAVTAKPLEERTGLAALKLMFEDFGTTARADLGIPNHYTTNPQAEVLLLEGAPRKYIGGVVVPTQAIKAKLEAAFPGLQLKLNGGYFGARRDHGHWK